MQFNAPLNRKGSPFSFAIPYIPDMPLHSLGIQRPAMPYMKTVYARVDQLLQLPGNGLRIILERWTPGMIQTGETADQDARGNQIANQRFTVRQHHANRAGSMAYGGLDRTLYTISREIQQFVIYQQEVRPERNIWPSGYSGRFEETGRPACWAKSHRHFLHVMFQVAHVCDDGCAAQFAYTRRIAGMIDMGMRDHDQLDVGEHQTQPAKHLADFVLRTRQPCIHQDAARLTLNQKTIHHVERQNRNAKDFCA